MRLAKSRGACQSDLIAARKLAGADQTNLLDVEARDTRQTDAGKMKECKCVIGKE